MAVYSNSRGTSSGVQVNFIKIPPYCKLWSAAVIRYAEATPIQSGGPTYETRHADGPPLPPSPALPLDRAVSSAAHPTHRTLLIRLDRVGTRTNDRH